MKKEKVLEIETQEVFDKVAVRIKYLNKDFFADGFFAEDMEKYNFNREESPYDSKEHVIFLGDNIIITDNNIYCYDKEKTKKIIEFVDLINEKYGIPKRWRAKQGEIYFFINSNCKIDTTKNYINDWDKFDDINYELGNYFKTKEEAEKVKEELDKFWAKVRAGEIGND